MSKISRDAGKAFVDCKPFKRGNTQVTVDLNSSGEAVMHLHGHQIARLTPDIGLEVSHAGHPTNITCDRLNGILQATPTRLRVVSSKGEFTFEYQGEIPHGKSRYYRFMPAWTRVSEAMNYFNPPTEPPKIDLKPLLSNRKHIAVNLLSITTGITSDQAVQVLSAFDFDLRFLAGQTPEAIRNLNIKGVGIKAANRIRASMELGRELARSHSDKNKITSPADVADLLMPILRYESQEIVVVLALDTKGNVNTKGIIADTEYTGNLLCESREIFKGTLNASVFHPREIFRFAIEVMANSIILAHNHPSGDPQPSQEDIRATKQLIEAGNQIGINVLDHIIIGDGIFVSLKEENFI